MRTKERLKLSDPLVLEGSGDNNEVGKRLDGVPASQKSAFRYREKYTVRTFENMISGTYLELVENPEGGMPSSLEW